MERIKGIFFVNNCNLKMLILWKKSVIRTLLWKLNLRTYSFLSSRINNIANDNWSKSIFYLCTGKHKHRDRDRDSLYCTTLYIGKIIFNLFNVFLDRLFANSYSIWLKPNINTTSHIHSICIWYNVINAFNPNCHELYLQL